jgi:purine-binding chemotaxis protein CheW
MSQTGMNQTGGQTSRRMATFSLGTFHFAVDVLDVQEVVRFQNPTRVPLAAPEIEGLINLRGQIVAAIDLRRQLGLGARDPKASPMNVIVRRGAEVLSFLVDEVGDVVEVREEDFEGPPVTLVAEVREALTGVYKLSRGLLLVLDVERVWDLQANAGGAPAQMSGGGR